MFDNGSDPPKEKQSRGLLLDPNTSNHTVTLVKQFTNPTKTLLASSQGNTAQPVPGENTAGNWLMGYGGLPNFTEYDSSGHVLLDGTLGKNVQDFRTYLAPWSGQAPGVPSVAVSGSVGRGELERRHERRLLAGARGRLGDDARAGRKRPEGGLSDDLGVDRDRRLKGRLRGACHRREGRRRRTPEQPPGGDVGRTVPTDRDRGAAHRHRRHARRLSAPRLQYVRKLCTFLPSVPSSSTWPAGSYSVKFGSPP